MPEAQPREKRRRQQKPPEPPPTRGHRPQVELAQRARETGKSLDELAAEDQAAKMAKDKPQMEGAWFRIVRANINGHPASALERLVCMAGHVSLERVHGPDVREACLERFNAETA